LSEQNTDERDGRHDFDFIAGKWRVHNKRLREWLKGSDEWEEFEATSVARLLFGGLGNLDEITMERGGGRVYGTTLRLFDPQTRLWSIYWASSTNGKLLEPMIGRFEGGRGEFYDQEIYEGQRVFSRFIWSVLDANTARWEQAFSPDGGRTWETNWTMDFTRME
jgi:hypothetical protein